MIKIDAKDLAYIQAQGKLLKVDPNVLLAVIEIESGGLVGSPDPIIRWEGHYFDRLVPAKLRDVARQQGLASPTAGKIKNPASQAARYAILDKAVAIDENAGYSSISAGVGQVMLSNWKDLGYASAKAMFLRAKEGLEGQVELMIRFIQFNNLVDELQRLDWSGFGRGYNGANYRQNNYHLNLKAAYERYAGQGVVVAAPAVDGMLRMGSQGQKVREVQALLNRAGFAVKVDGDFGPSTKDAVAAFQTKFKLSPVDGVVGPVTQAELLTWKTSTDEKPGEIKATEIPAFKTGTAIALGGGFLISILHNHWVLIGLAVLIGGAFFAIDAYQKSKLTYEGVSAHA